MGTGRLGSQRFIAGRQYFGRLHNTDPFSWATDNPEVSGIAARLIYVSGANMPRRL
ncbi:hypothetical protein [Aliamphritea spongicola]|nr:hypothetical protein [Aliamphritea spongicola]